METITAEELIRETGRSYRFVKRRLADAGLKPVGLDGRRIIFEADLARAAVPARTAAPGNGEDAGEFQRSRAVREKYAALTAKSQYKTLISGLIPREDANAALRFVETAMCSLLSKFPEQNAPALSAVSDIHETHALLTNACRKVLDDLGKAIERQKKATTRLGSKRRHMTESQRAMVAAELANMPPHRPTDKSANLHTSQSAAAEMMEVSPRSVATAAKISRDARRDCGEPELSADPQPTPAVRRLRGTPTGNRAANASRD
ncbi:MAG TPA: hypothetical protein PK225_14010 [Azonexus sp.]|jgi:hypothetical protein|nr:hypothetical protein [Azonexus sp.]